MVMGAVEGARRAVRRLQQINPPDRPADLNRLGRVDGALELAPGEQPDLQPHTPFSAFLAFERIGVDEIQVAQPYSGPLEPEGIEHGRASSDRRDAGHASTRPGSRQARQPPTNRRILPVCAKPPHSWRADAQEPTRPPRASDPARLPGWARILWD